MAIKNAELIEIVPFIMKMYRDFRYLPVSILGALYFLFSRKNQEKADQFFYQYSTGIDLQKTSPVYAHFIRPAVVLPLRKRTRTKVTTFIRFMRSSIPTGTRKNYLTHYREKFTRKCSIM